MMFRMLLHEIKLSVPLLQDEHLYDERIQWCDDHAGSHTSAWNVDLGEPYDDHDQGITMIDEIYMFADKNVALLFKLTWGGHV